MCVCVYIYIISQRTLGTTTRFEKTSQIYQFDVIFPPLNTIETSKKTEIYTLIFFFLFLLIEKMKKKKKGHKVTQPWVNHLVFFFFFFFFFFF
jgi:hypothetical protein